MSESPESSDLPIPYNADPHQALQPAGALTLAQTGFLASYVIEGTVKAACASAGIFPTTHYKWIRESAEYRERFQAIASVSLDEARARLNVLLPRAAEVFEEGLESDKPLAVTCPACEHEFTIRIPNEARRLAVARDLFKRSGDLAAKVQVSGEVKHRDMALEDRLALAQVSAWTANGRQGPCPVPPDVYDDLSRRGLLSGAGALAEQPGASNSRIDSAVHRVAQSMYQEQDELPVQDGEYADA